MRKRKGSINTTFREVIRTDDLDKVKGYCINGAPIANVGELPFIHFAALYGTPRIIKYLVGKGADINAQTMFTYNIEESPTELLAPLHLAIFNPDINSLLAILKLGANINPLTACQRTPIYMATIYGKNEALKALYNVGADIEIRSITASTPLIGAAYHKNTEAISLLCKWGANPLKIDFMGNTAFGILNNYDKDSALIVLRHIPVYVLSGIPRNDKANILNFDNAIIYSSLEKMFQLSSSYKEFLLIEKDFKLSATPILDDAGKANAFAFRIKGGIKLANKFNYNAEVARLSLICKTMHNTLHKLEGPIMPCDVLYNIISYLIDVDVETVIHIANPDLPKLKFENLSKVQGPIDAPTQACAHQRMLGS